MLCPGSIIIKRMERIVKVWQIGKIGYVQSVKLQKHIANMHQNNQNLTGTILLLEHPPVYTIGIRTKGYSPEDEIRLKSTGAEFYQTNRGGLITFHGPGQLVVYPILNLKHFKSSMKWYINHIENTIIHLCEHLGLKAYTSPHTGVWINDNKVCAIGVHGSRYITTHGLALNCNTDLKWFEHIVPCGIEGKGVTSLTKELNKVTTVEDIIPLFLYSFTNIFNCSCINYPQYESDVILSKI